jgi:hypothetical protein
MEVEGALSHVTQAVSGATTESRTARSDQGAATIERIEQSSAEEVRLANAERSGSTARGFVKGENVDEMA